MNCVIGPPPSGVYSVYGTDRMSKIGFVRGLLMLVSAASASSEQLIYQLLNH